MTKIEMGKQYRTRDGKEVRIYATEGGSGKCPIHGAVKVDEDQWMIMAWAHNGKMRGSVPDVDAVWDLIEIKPRIKCDVWVNVYKSFLSSHNSKTEADMYAAADRIACVKLTIDVEEGHGL